jgi:hypothetical protein
MNINELDSYDLKDAIRFHSRLNPRLWDGRERIKPEVREALLKIAADFQEFLGVPDLQVKDITVSGSNASYTYTPHSDIDLHLIVDIPELYDPVFRELFNAKKYQYNDLHNITVRDADVELYVQPADEDVVSQGEYSLKRNKWIQVPRRKRADINDAVVRNKYEDLKQRIENSIKSGQGAEELMKKIRVMRQAGLDEHGEFSAENLAFKMLRSQGYIERLANARSDAHARELSLDEKKQSKKKTRRSYGYSGGYWFPGFAYAGQDHPAGTEGGEQVEEGFADNLYKASRAAALAGAVATTPAAAEPPKTEAKPITVAYVTINGETRKFDLGDRFQSSRDAEKFVSDTLDRQGLEGTYSIDIRRGYPREKTKEDAGHTWDGVSASTTMFTSEDVGHTWDGVSPSTTMFTSEDESADVKTVVRKFAKAAAQHLGLQRLPQIRLVKNAEWSAKNNSFGRYDPETKSLILVTANRHIVDVLRTLAHELTHAAQDQRGELDMHSGKTGSQEENQANAEAGIIMRQFAEQYPEYFREKNLEEQEEEWEYDDGNDPPGPESPPQFPKGTVKVAVSDVYDWYKLGQGISDLDDFDKSSFGKGPPSTVISFGDEDLEHKYIKSLKRLGMPTQDLDESSGYIPSEAEKDDPRFSMALTVDIRPDSMQKNAKKLGWKIARDGTPPLLRESEELFEVAMTPRALEAWARSPEAQDIHAGFEAELCFRDTYDEEGESELEPDYDADQRPGDIDDVVDFFSDDEWGYGLTRSQQERLRSDLTSEYYEWIDNKIDDNLFNEFSTWMWENEWPNRREDLIGDELYNADIEGAEASDALEAGRLENVDHPLYAEYQRAETEARIAFEDEIQDQYEKKSSSPWEEFYDEYRAEFMDNNSERDFLRSEYGYMSDIGNSFDLSWPYMTETGGNAGSRNPDEIRTSLAAAVNMRVKMSTGYHSIRREPGLWIIEGDSSIHPDDDIDAGFEVVSPEQTLSKTLSDMDKVMEWARDIGGYTNSSTGLHMNISIPHRGADVDYVKLLLFMGDQHVLEQFGRTAIHFCSSSMTKLADYVASAKKAGLKKIPDAFELMRKNLIELATRNFLHGEGGRNKYQSAHVHRDDKGKPSYIEFRGPGGDYLDKSNEELNTTFLRLARAMQIAGDPSAERQEYGKKLYKLLAPEGDSAMMKMFASYSAGGITGEQLKNEWASKVLHTTDPQDTSVRTWEIFDERRPDEVLGQVDANIYDMPNYIINNFDQKDWLYIDYREVDGVPKDIKTRKADLARKIQGVAQQRPEMPVPGGSVEYIARLKDARYPSIYNVRFQTPDVGNDFSQAAAALWRTLRSRGYSQDQIDEYTIDSIESPYGVVMRPGGAVGGEQSTDANYEIINLDNQIPVFRFIANTDEEARRKFNDWLSGRDRDDRSRYNVRRIEGRGIPGSTAELARQRAASADQEFSGTWEIVSRTTDEVVHQFSGVGNAIRDAEVYGRRWALDTGFDDPYYLRPLMRPRHTVPTEPGEENNPQFRVTYTVNDGTHTTLNSVNITARNANAAMERVHSILIRNGNNVESIEAEEIPQPGWRNQAQGTESLPPGNTRWLVLDQNDREVYSFVHRSNQGEANQYAANWLRQNGLLGSGEFMVVPAR